MYSMLVVVEINTGFLTSYQSLYENLRNLLCMTVYHGV